MSREMEGIERIRAGPAQGGKNPDELSPQELHAVLWQVLSFRDSGWLLLFTLAVRMATDDCFFLWCSCEEDRENHR
jgi:hypothetical protein